jgi:metallo-beta-lactamase family protein
MRLLQDQGRMPRIPVYIDSPMAVSVTHLYQQSKEEMDEDMLLSLEEGRSELEPEGVQFVRDSSQSKALNFQRGPMMIISGSGMANGGRVVHHLLHRISDPNNIILFTGYQADGTLGRRILDGEPEVRIMKQEVPVRAKVKRLNALSAHADQEEILRWLGGFEVPPRKTFIVHGEPPAQEALRAKIAAMGWDVVIPSHGDTHLLG